MSKEQEFNEEIEEEIIEVYEEDDAISQIKKYGTIVVVVLVVVAIAVFSYNYMNEQADAENAEASKYLARVVPLMAQGDFEKALNGDVNIIIDNKPLIGFKDIASTYAGSDVGAVASFYAGKALLMQGKFDEAKSYFEKATSNESNEVKVGAYNGLAACQEEVGQFKEASGNYEAASNLVEQLEMKSKYLYFSGLTAEKAGDASKAKSMYEKVIRMNSENAYSEFGGLSSAGLERVGTKIDG